VQSDAIGYIGVSLILIVISFLIGYRSGRRDEKNRVFWESYQPQCSECGVIMERFRQCFKCPNCGAVSGRS
jgi:hypothetical protein